MRRLLAERGLGVRIGHQWRILGSALLDLSAPARETESGEVADWLRASASSLQELWDNEDDAVYDRL